ncbi:MAG TPA: homocysteine S-methyltransferase family protein [Phycisphaeraceae bacterium]|nr:homocysteine S-methyltransferase family protein [Phycisphaeraceae bacterium]
MYDYALTFMERKQDQPVLVLDGAMGSLLEERGVNTTLPLWSARALVEAPGMVREIHAQYIAAGCNIITANTFRTQNRTLAKVGMKGKAAELTRLAVTLAQQARRESDRGENIRIAGSLAPLEDCYRPDLSPSFAEALTEHEETARYLADAGVDLILIETMPAAAEAAAALQVAADTGLTVWLSLQTREPGVFLSGESLLDFLDDLSPLPEAVLVNCIPPGRVMEELQLMRSHLPAAVRVGAYANVGRIDESGKWRSEGGMSPVEYAALVLQWVKQSAGIVGACCGSNPSHIRAITEVLTNANLMCS